MDFIKEADFRKEIKSSPRAAYLFFGDEDYMKKFALDTAVQAISPEPSFAFFNEIRLDSFSYSPEALVDAFMPAPMMADRKLVVLSGLDINSMRSFEVEALCQAVDAIEDYDYNTLIISASADKLDAGNMPKCPSSLVQKLAEHLTPVYFEKNSPARLAAWVGKHFEHNGVIASAEICALVIDRCGRDMFNLANETDKLSFYVLKNGRQEVTHEDVMSIATPSSEFDTFALSNAIGARRRDEALEILRDMKGRRLDPIIIISEITKTVCEMLSVAVLRADGMTQREISEALKIHEYRLGIILRTLPDEQMCRLMLTRCHDADLEIKSFRNGFEVLETLICTI
ncbi:MAG: DNA polymerase III subunit delta [Ruminococcaceae bacterium]|nr:DNA polymerase III subunit delta [Oscillospiraceae bacterium]